METENNRLDQHIKQNLENFKPAFNEAHWEVFENMLDAEEAAEIDGIVVAGLANFETNTTVPNWDLMEQKLEAAEISETTEFDKIVQKLNNYEAKYENSHWQLMAKKLEEEFSLRQKLYRYKVVELTLMLLLLFTFINYMPFGGNKIQQLKDWKKYHFDNKKSTIPSETSPQKIANNQPIAANTESTNEVYKTGIESKEIPFFNNEKIDNQQKLTLLSDRIIQNKPATLPQKINFVEIEKSNAPTQLAFGNYNLQEGDINVNKNLVKTSLLAALDIPKTNVLTNVFDVPAVIIEPNKNKGLWTMSFSVNSDINYIISDDVPELSAKRDTTLGFGYGGGLMIGYRKGRFGLEFGGQYTYKKYPPNTDSRVTNQPGNPSVFFIENLKDIQLDILQIPVNIQYYAINKPKWKVYTTSGVSLNMIALPVYQIESQIQSFVGAPASAPPGGEPVNSFRNTSEFPEGIFSGGSFKDNAYFTANIGFGIEGAFSPRWSIFAQPTYQHYFSKNGVKPFRDKFYTLSFSLGARVNLK